MIEPVNYQMVCPNNATFEFHAVWEIDGTPVDMTGALAAMQVRPTYSSAAALIDLNQTSGITVDGSGNIDITVDGGHRAAWPGPAHPTHRRRQESAHRRANSGVRG